ncbi:adenylyltransferase/cytidyltransferase family protein [Chloroflexota bacterium]
MTKKVFVSGSFDMLHSGHIAFFKEASTFGDLYVALGSDKTVYELKGRLPINSQEERQFMVNSVEYVKDSFISQGSGMLDFLEEFKQLQPDIMVVNTDGNTPEKQQLCAGQDVEYIILQREPYADLPARTTTALRAINQIPFRIDIAGGWLDQPYVSKHYPGSVITISLEPTIQFNERSGMATSTRRAAIDLWGPRLPPGDPEKIAKILFCYDNPPGTEVISGSQDTIGIVFPGLTKAYYDGAYWPVKFERILDETTISFVESSFYLVPLGPRHADFDVLADTRVDSNKAKALADAADACWQAIQNQDVHAFGASFRASFEAQIAMFPNMMNDMVTALITKYQDVALGWKLSGAGGGGYLILVCDKPIKDALRVVAHRESD